MNPRTDLDYAAGDRPVKALATLAGRSLHRTNPDDGSVSYYALHRDQVRNLASLVGARRFLAQIGGTA